MNINQKSSEAAYLDLQSKNINNYTLVEMIVVISIIVILSTIAVPALERVAIGGSVDIAARTVSKQLALARAHAITKNEYVAVLIPLCDHNSGAPLYYPGRYTGADPALYDANPSISVNASTQSSEMPSEYYNRSLRACIVDYDAGSNEYNFKRWLPGEKWEFLPTAVIIPEIDTDPEIDNPPTNDSGSFSTVNNVDIADIASEGDAYDESTYTTRLDTAYTTRATFYAHDVAAIIFKPSGRPEDTGTGGRYVNFVQGVYQNSDIVVKNPDVLGDANSGICSKVKVDGYTGRVTFGSE